MAMISKQDLSRLPNPHLAHYISPEVLGYDPADFDKEVRRAMLLAAHLPDNYDSINDVDQRNARMATLTSWYDPSKPSELCSDVDKYIAAHFCWVEFYLKPDESTGGAYYSKDSIVKYDILRACMSPSLSQGQPSKTVMHAPRGTTKTKTIIHEGCSLMAITRPNTQILVSEINGDRTIEEMHNIRSIVEENELIQRDFGGRGTLYSMSQKSGLKWSDKRLDFKSFPNCSILGHSFESRQRGRHPIYGVIDDPEDEGTVADQKFRRKFFANMFRRYMGMFIGGGGKVVWVGTVIRSSCLQIALKSKIDQASDSVDIAENYDDRFNDWRKIHYGMIREDEDGKRYSIMEDHTSVKVFDEKCVSLGVAAVAAELQGEPIAEGQFALERHTHKHGYMHCEANEEAGQPDEYMLDLLTGTKVPWEEFVESLSKAGGCDIADSTAKDADYGANVVVGLDADRTVFVLDAIVDKQIADDWPETAYMMCDEWGATRQGFESDAMQKVVYRMAERLRVEWENDGRHVPMLNKINNAGQNKHHRILSAIRPLYRKRAIRFPHFKSIMTPDGVTHTPVKQSEVMLRAFVELLRELDTYTDEGSGNYDDAADALHMAIRTAGSSKGTIAIKEDVAESSLEKWRASGMDWESVPHLVPPEAWTPEMRQRMMSPVEQEDDVEDVEVDPYEYA